MNQAVLENRFLKGIFAPIDQEYTLVNGLTLTLGAGDLVQNTTFTLDVYDAMGSSVDPDKVFDGIDIVLNGFWGRKRK